MNRLILKFGYLITAAILLLFAWVVGQRLAQGLDAIVPLIVGAVIVWPLATLAFICFWPRITVGGFKRAILRRGIGDGPIPVNTLYAEPEGSSYFASSGSPMATGTDDLLYIVGWLDLKTGPQFLHVPAMAGRYYSVQLTDPSTGANVAYVGTRATGTTAGTFFLSTPAWSGTVPPEATRITLPHRSALVIGRVFTAGDVDRPAAYSLATQIRLTPLRERMN